MKKWKRRDFLRNSVLAGMLAPVAGYWLDMPEAKALTEKRHMVLVFLPNGKCRENVYLERTAGGFDLGPGFAPYERYREDMIAIEEYAFHDIVSEHYTGDHAGHFASALTMFSGDIPFVRNDIGTAALQPTIDQIVAADYLDRGVITNPLRKSLAIKMRGSSFKAPSVFYQAPPGYTLGSTYTDERVPVTLTESPRDAFRQMFGDLAAMGGTDIDQLWAQGGSILDVPGRELEALRDQLPSAGHHILDQHLTGLRELELGLAESPLDPSFPVPAEPPELDTRTEAPERVWSEWVRVIDAALRLDRTRIVSVQLGGIASRFQVPSLGLGYVGDGSGSNSGTDHHSYTHHQAADVDLFMEWYSLRVTELLDELKGIGATAKADILYDSAVMVGAEFGWNHRAYDVPVSIFGQCGGALRTNQLLTYGNDISSAHKHTGTLTALVQAMGTDLDAVGRPVAAYQQGPVRELLA
ncbi:MAG: DUF1552 domain-containing protein [Deltaproteobacteria bacterium]|nr:DUF1552 domain-containing protein [Deltaproteobacteria bacterium]